MFPIGKLADSKDTRLVMVAVHRMWALWFQRQRDHQNKALQFHAAQELLVEARDRRILRRGK